MPVFGHDTVGTQGMNIEISPNPYNDADMHATGLYGVLFTFLICNLTNLSTTIVSEIETKNNETVACTNTFLVSKFDVKQKNTP